MAGVFQYWSTCQAPASNLGVCAHDGWVQFGEYLQELLDKRGYSALTYAQLIGYRRNGLVSNVLKGERRPPPKKIGQWMRPLRLTDEEAARFRELAKSASAKSKRGDRPYVEGIEGRMDAAELLLIEASSLLEEAEKRSGGQFKIPSRLRQAVNSIRRERGL